MGCSDPNLGKKGQRRKSGPSDELDSLEQVPTKKDGQGIHPEAEIYQWGKYGSLDKPKPA